MLRQARLALERTRENLAVPQVGVGGERILEATLELVAQVAAVATPRRQQVLGEILTWAEPVAGVQVLLVGPAQAEHLSKVAMVALASLGAMALLEVSRAVVAGGPITAIPLAKAAMASAS